MGIVKKHTRTGKNKSTVVRQHARSQGARGFMQKMVKRTTTGSSGSIKSKKGFSTIKARRNNPSYVTGKSMIDLKAKRVGHETRMKQLTSLNNRFNKGAGNYKPGSGPNAPASSKGARSKTKGKARR